MISNNLQTPNVFRVLIIDDQITSDHECESRTGHSSSAIQSAITRYLEKLVRARKNDALVEVEYAKDPDEGVFLWLDQIFDLTLVDSDFSKGVTSKTGDKDKRNFLDLRLDFAGAYLFCFLLQMLKSDEYSKARKGCEVALWTGLGIGDNGGEKDRRANQLVSILPVGSHCSFIPKRDVVKGLWHDMVSNLGRVQKMGTDDKGNNIEIPGIEVLSIEECLSKMQATNPVLNNGINDGDIIIERIKNLYSIKSPDVFRKFCHFDEPVYTGCLCSDTLGNVSYSPNWNAGGNLLSPLLRRHISEKDIEAIGLSLSEVCDRMILGCTNDIQTPIVKEALPPNRHIVAAATPLTGCSAVGKDRAKRLMGQKLSSLLDGPFDQIVLKTVYLDSLDQWDNLHWPTLQAQSHHRTRCLRSTAHPRTLWNTGITALESFTPEMMHEFLRTFASNDATKRIRTIVSLGSKFPQWNLNAIISRRNKKRKASGHEEEPLKTYRNHILDFTKHIGEFRIDLEAIWQNLFLMVFDKNDKDAKTDHNLKGNKQYPIVEINVRHYLRECVAYHLGGHEYLSPAKIDPDRKIGELDFAGCYQSLDLEFNTWLEVLDKTAKDFDKKLLLKLPFRGDVLHFIRLIRDYVKIHKDDTCITGITLINAFKSGVIEPERGVTYSPAWYGRLDAWRDAADRKWTYQMSGELLTASRNELLGEALRLVSSSDLDVHISGGIVDAEGIRYCSPVVVRTSRCVKCGACTKVCDHDAITVVLRETPAIIDQSKCVSCRKCIDKCPVGAIGLPVQIGTWALMDLNLGESQWLSCANMPPSIGNGQPTVTDCKKTCSPCYVKCRHGAFSSGGNGKPARIDIGKCIECKECLRMCPHGAITLGVDNAKSISHSVSDNPRVSDRRINPRIAFCLHELCNGCGKCSRTFYCDTFMDRRGLDLPPVMDSRNCTGCGLCVQTCPHGAIQLFNPKHVVVLIGMGDNLSAWQRRLMAYEIPHLVFRQEEIEEYYLRCEEESHSQDMKKMFTYRKDTDIFFDKLSKDYTDDRCWDDNLKEVLNKAKDINIIQKWLFLAWSDPGQVLKDSPVIYAINVEECYYFDNSLNAPVCGLLLNDVLAHPGMSGICTEVNNRLRNLREVR